MPDYPDDGLMTKAVDVRITGLVQGVSFRFYTQMRAEELGVSGWVRNEADGAVTGHFEGPERAVDALVDWCRHGPVYADVEGVEVRAGAVSGATTFATG